MSSKKGTLWPAPPHTVAKIEMLGKYLRVWFEILGRRGRDLWYIDGFAGPGEYTNHADGSPIAAVKAAGDALNALGAQAPTIHCVFIEENRKRLDNLNERLAKETLHANVKVTSIQGTFVAGMQQLRLATPNPFTANAPTFAFLDPFGPEGLPFSLVKELLSRPTCEVLINLDSDGIGRIYRAGGWANHKELLDTTFGDSEWESVLSDTHDIASAIPRIVALYKRKLRALPDVKYCYSFEMRSRSNSLDYHLVFASRHRLGLERMKDAMKTIDQTGGYCFSDGYVNQHLLFREDDLPTYIEKTAKHFAGRTVTYDEVDDFALNETIYTRGAHMLTPLEKAERVTVTSPFAARRKFTFGEKSTPGMMIQFEESSNGPKI